MEGGVLNNYMQELTNKEIEYLIGLVEVEKAVGKLLRGHRKPNKEEQDMDAEFNRLKEKLKRLIK